MTANHMALGAPMAYKQMQEIAKTAHSMIHTLQPVITAYALNDNRREALLMENIVTVFSSVKANCLLTMRTMEVGPEQAAKEFQQSTDID